MKEEAKNEEQTEKAVYAYNSFTVNARCSTTVLL